MSHKINHIAPVIFICMLAVFILGLSYALRHTRDENTFDSLIKSKVSELVHIGIAETGAGVISDNTIVDVAARCKTVNYYKDESNTNTQKVALDKIHSFCVQFAQSIEKGVSGEMLRSMTTDVDRYVYRVYLDQLKMKQAEYEAAEKKKVFDAKQMLKSMASES